MKELSYYPDLSVEENARLNGVSVATVRMYIKECGIDRRFDEQYKIFTAVKKLQEQDLTASQIRKRSGYSYNTVKKYMQMTEFPFRPSTEKYSAFDRRKIKNIVKSVSTNQTTILNSILQLYVNNNHYQADFTYSVGVFWKGIRQPDYKFDKYPQSEDVKPLTEAFLLPDGTLNNCVIDLPFIVQGNGSKITNRFTSFASEEELYATNKEMIELAYKKLRKGGYLIMKTMDVSYSLKQMWVSDFVIQTAQKTGFELKDKFILITNKRLLSGGQQHFARKHHSYFFVFKKK